MTDDTDNQRSGKVLFWGTFDIGKPRTRLLIKAVGKGFNVVGNIHCHLWSGVEDKSQIRNLSGKLRILVRAFLIYPRLLGRYLLSPKHEILILPYMGLFDLLVIWPFARMRGVKICLDIFISLYDTVVLDRRLLPQRGIRARVLYRFERCILHLADKLIIDTRAHARYVEELYGLHSGAIDVVWVGVENDVFPAMPWRGPLEGRTRVLFFGQFIPLHGLDVIVGAAERLQAKGDSSIEFLIVGRGQLQNEIDALICERNLRNVQRLEWVAYDKLCHVIAAADICLGVFAATGKSLRVIPNKVFQVLAVGRPLITADTPALRELPLEQMGAVVPIPPGDAGALANAILSVSQSLRDGRISVRPVCGLGVDLVAYQVKVVLDECRRD